MFKTTKSAFVAGLACAGIMSGWTNSVGAEDMRDMARVIGMTDSILFTCANQVEYTREGNNLATAIFKLTHSDDSLKSAYQEGIVYFQALFSTIPMENRGAYCANGWVFLEPILKAR